MDLYTKRAEAVEFIKLIRRELQVYDVDQSLLHTMDHIAYRTQTMDEYQHIKHFWLKHGSAISEVPHNGREITVVKLHDPVYSFNTVSVLELPAPHPDPAKAYPSGWEHAEFVIDDLHEFVKTYAHTDRLNTEHIHRERNPEVKLSLPHGRVKFHLTSLETIVHEEQLE